MKIELNQGNEDKTMNKVIRDGKVAVLYSPGFGAGWYTWNEDHEECIFDPDIVALVEKNDDGKYTIEIEKLAEEKYEHFYTGGAEDLRIEWLDEGQAFRIDEYDGSETIQTLDSLSLIA